MLVSNPIQDGTRCQTHQRLGPNRKHNLLLPRSTQTDEDILLRHVLDLNLVVVFWIVAKDDALDLVGGAAQPALVVVAENRLELRLGACDVRHIANRHIERTPEEPPEMGSRVLELVGLVVSLVDRDKDSEVVLPRHHLDRRSGELGHDLVKSASVDPLFGAIDVKGAHGGVVRRLLRQVANADWLGRVRRHFGDRHGRRSTAVPGAQLAERSKLPGLDARGAAARQTGALPERPGIDPGRIVFCFPVAL